MGALSTIVLILFVIVALALIFMVAIQSEDNDGLGGIFGGDSSSAFGGHTNKVVTRITASLGIAFVVLAILVAIVNK